MDNRYLQIVRQVEECMSEWGKPSRQNEEAVIQQITNSPWAINFDAVTNTYNTLFWTRNFWKAAYFFSYDYSLTPATMQRLIQHQHLQATFVGGGAGADVLALMTWFTISFPLATLTITVLDRSQQQLDRLQLFVSRTKDLLDDSAITVRYVQMDAAQWHPEADTTDLLVLGHFLTENPHDVHRLMLKSNTAVREGGDVVMIERPQDAVLYHAKQVLADAGLTVHHTLTDNARMKLILQQIPKPGNSGLTAHYLRATQPDKKRKAEIVSTYFSAWRHQTVEPLYEIFNPTATYDRQPGIISPVKGIDDMVTYWMERPMRQSDVKVLIRNVAYTESTAVCAFEADFNTPQTHETVKGAICFTMDQYTQKIQHMTGHYGVVQTPL